METVILTSFTEATKNILNEIGFTDFIIGNKGPGPTEQVRMLATVGLVGDLKGHFVLKIGDGSIFSFVKTISGHLEMNSEDPQDPQYRKSVLGEIANQIGGRATALLSEKGIECMITPPTVIVGENVETSLPESDEKLSFPVEGGFGHFSCMIALKKIKLI
jgi:chemotaxis protein CheX